MGWSHADYFAKSTGPGIEIENSREWTCRKCGYTGIGPRTKKYCNFLADGRNCDREAARERTAKWDAKHRRKAC